MLASMRAFRTSLSNGFVTKSSAPASSALMMVSLSSMQLMKMMGQSCHCRSWRHNPMPSASGRSTSRSITSKEPRASPSASPEVRAQWTRQFPFPSR